LHTWLGRQYGLEVTYELFDLVLDDTEDLAALLHRLGEQGYRGLNITYPYKVKAWDLVRERRQTPGPMGALNTLVFESGTLTGSNTDCTGFSRAYRDAQPGLNPGRVFIKGTGGVGRAIAFGLSALEAEHIYLYDEHAASQQQLLADLQACGARASVVAADQVVDCARGCDGLVNATPVGHYTTPGASFSAAELGGQRWAFDAVYTPVMTEFLQGAEGAGLTLITGFELFLYQGIEAFESFTGIRVDPAVARRGLHDN
jgi:shikimate dehydrogenase